ncbi:MAG: hypothetical protein L0Y56_00920, partial [Nitrospira sp.]|nr:hypothetical protein [Nitrospira sp.]
MPFMEIGKYGNPLLSSERLRAENILGGTISAQQLIIAGGIHGVIRSQNYNASSAGWAIFGDGSASFYGNVTLGANAIIIGDLYSSNWNGTIPANLASVDSGATTGYYLDSSVGAMQAMGNIWAGSNITLLSGGKFRTADSGDRIEIGGTDAFIELYDATSGLVGQIGWAATGYGANELTIENQSGLGDIFIGADGAIELDANGASGFGVVVLNGDPAGAVPSSPFRVVANTGPGMRFHNSTSASTPAWAFDNDTNTGFYRVSADVIGVATGGVKRAEFSAGGDVLRLYGGANDNVFMELFADAADQTYRSAWFGFGSAGSSVMSINNEMGGYISLVSGDELARFLDGGSASHMQLRDGLTDVGNHETLRLNRGTGTT